MSDYENFGRDHVRLTGLIDSILIGDTYTVDSSHLSTLASRAEFEEDSSVVTQHQSGLIKRVPTVNTRNAIGNALVEGLVLGRYEVEGTLPSHIALDPGSYTFQLHLLDERWVGLAVDSAGGVACMTFGVVVRQLISAHLDRPHRSEARVQRHLSASANLLRRLGVDDQESGWTDTHVGWEPLGSSEIGACLKTTVCVADT